MNTTKNKSMTSLGTPPIHQISTDAYTRMITREGSTDRKKRKMIVECTHCNTQVQTQSIKRHQQSKSCMEVQKQASNNQPLMCIPIPVPTPQELSLQLISLQHNPHCPHPSCPYSTNKAYRMRKHCRNRHPDDIIWIAKEGLLPQCPHCGLFQANSQTPQHQNSNDCIKHSINKQKRRQEIAQQAARNVKFYIGNEEIKKVYQFKYLGRIIMTNNNDLKAVEQQLGKARKMWARIEKLFKKTHKQ
jgi:hypothetical protein